MKDEYQFPFEKLRVWQQSRSWVKAVYKMTGGFPKSEAFNLVSQLNRAAVSVAANLAEGSARTSARDQAHFSNISYSSLMEAACLLILAKDLEFASEEALNFHRREISQIANQINALRNAQLKVGE